MAFDIYQDVTDRLVAAIEKGTLPWVRPWNSHPTAGGDIDSNFRSKKPYRGVNTLLLWMRRAEMGYQSPRWLTYKQAAEIGAHVRKGEKGTKIVFWKIREFESDDPKHAEGDGKVKIPLARAYTVFNLEQCDDVPAELLPVPEPALAVDELWSAAKAFCDATQATIDHGGDRAFYNGNTDRIRLPNRGQFTDRSQYYATKIHELIHWTGHHTRLNRERATRFGDDTYAFEELIAETGAAFASVALGLPYEKLQHEQYIGSWLRIMKGDAKAVFTAASKARAAHEFLAKFSSKEEKAA